MLNRTLLNRQGPFSTPPPTPPPIDTIPGRLPRRERAAYNELVGGSPPRPPRRSTAPIIVANQELAVDPSPMFPSYPRTVVLNHYEGVQLREFVPHTNVQSGRQVTVPALRPLGASTPRQPQDDIGISDCPNCCGLLQNICSCFGRCWPSGWRANTRIDG